MRLCWAKPISTSESIGYDWNEMLLYAHRSTEEYVLYTDYCVYNVKKFIGLKICAVNLCHCDQWRKETPPVHLGTSHSGKMWYLMPTEIHISWNISHVLSSELCCILMLRLTSNTRVCAEWEHYVSLRWVGRFSSALNKFV